MVVVTESLSSASASATSPLLRPAAQTGEEPGAQAFVLPSSAEDACDDGEDTAATPPALAQTDADAAAPCEGGGEDPWWSVTLDGALAALPAPEPLTSPAPSLPATDDLPDAALPVEQTASRELPQSEPALSEPAQSEATLSEADSLLATVAGIGPTPRPVAASPAPSAVDDAVQPAAEAEGLPEADAAAMLAWSLPAWVSLGSAAVNQTSATAVSADSVSGEAALGVASLAGVSRDLSLFNPLSATALGSQWLQEEAKPLATAVTSAATALTAVDLAGLLPTAAPQRSLLVSANAVVSEQSLGALSLQGEPDEWAGQLVSSLGERVRLQADNRQSLAYIRLDPPELGRLEIALRQEGDRLSIQIHTSNQSLREALQETREQLRQVLIPDFGAGVAVDIHFGQEGQSAQAWLLDEVVTANADAASETSAAAPRATATGRGLLDARV